MSVWASACTCVCVCVCVYRAHVSDWAMYWIYPKKHTECGLFQTNQFSHYSLSHVHAYVPTWGSFPLLWILFASCRSSPHRRHVNAAWRQHVWGRGFLCRVDSGKDVQTSLVRTLKVKQERMKREKDNEQMSDKDSDRERGRTGCQATQKFMRRQAWDVHHWQISVAFSTGASECCADTHSSDLQLCLRAPHLFPSVLLIFFLHTLSASHILEFSFPKSFSPSVVGACWPLMLSVQVVIKSWGGGRRAGPCYTGRG